MVAGIGTSGVRSEEMSPSAIYEHKEVVRKVVNISQDELTRQAIRDRVSVLRQARYDNMPYLDKGYVRWMIHPEKVKAKMQFSSGDEKKLDDLVARAIAVHTPAKATRERISLARRRIILAIRNLFPEASFQYRDKDGKLSGGKFNSRSYNFVLKQPIFRGGILWNTVLEERARLKAETKQYDKIIGDIIRDVSKAYFEYHRTLQLSRDQQSAIEEMKIYKDMSDAKFLQELISEIEHLNVQSLFSQMKYDYETTRQELELAKLDLQNYLDLDIEDTLEISELYDIEALKAGDSGEKILLPPDDESVWGDVMDPGAVSGGDLPNLGSLVDLAYQNRPELQVEAAELTAARIKERIKWGEMMPQANLIFEAGALGEAYDFIQLHPKKSPEVRVFLELKWNAGGSTVGYQIENNENAPSLTVFESQGTRTQTTTNTFTVNLLDGLDALVNVKEAEAEKLDQIVELENTEKEVIQDVKQAYFDYQKSLIQVKSSLKRLDYRGRVAGLKKHKMGENEIQISEFMQAEIEYLQEKMELHKAFKEYFAAKAALNRAVGIRDYLPIEESYGN